MTKALPQWQKNRNALKRKLRSLPEYNFDMNPILSDIFVIKEKGKTTKIRTSCNTVGCIAGWCATVAKDYNILTFYKYNGEWVIDGVNEHQMAKFLGTDVESVDLLIHSYDIEDVEEACVKIDNLPVKKSAK